MATDKAIGRTMRAARIESSHAPLLLGRFPVPTPGPGELLLEVRACGVCRTDLHLLDGELPDARLPVIPGHQIVGRVVAVGPGAAGFEIGARVGVPWLGRTCGVCRFCAAGRENLCLEPVFTGCNVDGGFAEYAVANARFVFPLPDGYDDLQAAPLLCAGLIGYRSLKLAGEHVRRLGIFGFGAAGHIVAQVARYQGIEVFAFTRPGDETAQAFARSLGAVWAGASDERPGEPLDAAIIFAPSGELVPAALAAVDRGGTVVCGGIHMSDIPSFPYRLLWEERTIRSVANLTRRDGEELLTLAPKIPIRTEVEVFSLDEAAEALSRLREGRLRGAAVLALVPPDRGGEESPLKAAGGW
jgi:alcohol dehydrogenase, propanol-preferring